MNTKMITYPLVVGLLSSVLSGCFQTEVKPEIVVKDEVPDFAAIRDVNAKKAAFFAYLQPAFDVVTAEVLAERQQLKDWQAQATLTVHEQAELQQMARMYKVTADSDQALIVALLRQVDVIPEALVFSQSANETGWGSSRFAKLGNNFFGQWCFSKGCGIVPTQRTQGSGHEVASFASVEDSMRSYFRNINRNQHYLPLHEIRAELRMMEQDINACALAVGLIHYSERKDAYIAEIHAMIRHNRQFWRDKDYTDYSLCAAPKMVKPEMEKEAALKTVVTK